MRKRENLRHITLAAMLVRRRGTYKPYSLFPCSRERMMLFPSESLVQLSCKFGEEFRKKNKKFLQFAKPVRFSCKFSEEQRGLIQVFHRNKLMILQFANLVQFSCKFGGEARARFHAPLKKYDSLAVCKPCSVQL